MRSAEEASLIGTFAELDEAYGAGCADGMKVDEEGNVWYAGTARNFNQVMATAADIVIAEAEKLGIRGRDST